MDEATQLARCPRCGAELPEDTSRAECPACRLEQARATTLTGEEPTRLSPGRTSSGNEGGGQRLTPGQMFGPYRIERLLGRGGMGEVYAAEQLEHGRHIALKVLSRKLADAKDRARFLREGQLAASINHPHSVYIFGSEEIDGTPVIAMELLPGGTLKDRITESGPLPPGEAVDAILQLIAGLAAAHATGILHRDIKPSNCFVDRDGLIKVGDFGLSISALAREPSALVSGTFEGTPQFAAPEQLRGEALDVRADIYGVGATLYYALTGRPPFAERELTVLLEKIAAESPASPRVLAAGVPEGLAAIVLDCLARDKAGRPGTYAELDDRLRPFSSTTPRQALLRSRFVAAAIDYMLLTVCFHASATFLRIIGVGVWWLPVRFLVATLYFTLTEGYGGASAGKRLLGLRVQTTDRGAPAISRVFARSLLFVLAWEVVNWIPTDLWLSQPQPSFRQVMERAELRGIVSLVKSIVAPFVPLTLFLLARPRNGFAGIHELISATRVVRSSTMRLSSKVAARDRVPLPTESQPAQGLQARGPFLLVTPLTPTASFWRAIDPLLKRDVWIRDLPDDGMLSNATRREVARPGRLRWLAGQRTPNGSWEAFEAPGGQSLLALIAKPQPWEIVRQWLLDLAGELKHVDDADDLVLGLDRVWIADDGHAKLLDFRAPGAAPIDEAAGPEATRGSHAVQPFLQRVAWSALAGRIVSAADDPPVIRPPLSESSRAVLLALSGFRWTSVEPWLDACLESSQEPLAASRWSRAFQPAIVATLCVVFLLGWINLLVLIGFRGTPSGRRTVVVSESSVLLNGLSRIERLRWAGAPADDPERRALEVYVARRFSPLAARQELQGSLRLFRASAIDIARRHASVSDADFLAALRELGDETVDRLSQSDMSIEPLPVLFEGMSRLGYLAWLSMGLAFAFRGGLTFQLFRVVVVNTEGFAVSRVRALLRAACAWSPLIAFQLAPPSAKLVLMTHPVAAWTVLGTIAVTMIGGSCWAIIRPERGLQDLLARTWVVRK